MKKLLLILLCVPLIYSCGDKKETDKDEDIELSDRANGINYRKKADSLRVLYYQNLIDQVNSIEHISKSLEYYRLSLLSLPYKLDERSSEESDAIKYSMAECYMLLKGYDQAIILLKEICVDFEKDKDAYLLLAQCFYNIDDEKESLNICDSLITQHPLFIEPLLLSGNIYAENYDDKALKYYELALQIDSLSIKALYGKGLFLQNNQRYSEALDLYYKMKEIDPFNIDATFNLGFIFMELRDFNIAINYFSDVILTEEMYYKAYLARGICFEKKGDIRAAERDYRRSLEIYPSYMDAQGYLDRLLLNNEKYK